MTLPIASEVAYRAAVMTPLSGDAANHLYLSDGYVCVDADGRIAHVGPNPEGLRGEILDLSGRVLVPGFVDAHLHYPQTRIVGSATGPLLAWLERSVFPEEARFADEAYARAVAAEFVRRVLEVGTTSVGVFSSSQPEATAVLLDALDRAGLRGFAGVTLMDARCPEALQLPRERALEACRALAARFHGLDRGRLRLAATPRFALSCSKAMMEDAAALAMELELPIQTHVSENVHEGEETLRAHPFASDYVGVYDTVGLLGPRTLLAHAIHLSEAEWDRVAARGASVVHCPDSNYFLGSGRMRWRQARARGIRVALGSDVAAGRTFDMRRVAASAYDTALSLGDERTPAELLRAATLGGAEAMGAADVSGSLEVGKDADFAVLRVPPYVEDEAALLGHVMFATTETPVEQVFVRGRRVWPKANGSGSPAA
jgi:guanine deaminase